MTTLTAHGTVWLGEPGRSAAVFPSKRVGKDRYGLNIVEDNGTWLAYHGNKVGFEWDGASLRRFVSYDEALACVEERRSRK